MKKQFKKANLLVVLFVMALLILISSGCDTIFSDSQSTALNNIIAAQKAEYDTPDETQVRGHEGTLVVHRFQVGTELSKNGVFQQFGNGEEMLLVDLGQNDLCFFIEEDYLYSVGPFLVRWDLDAVDPESTMERHQILPLDCYPVHVGGHDDNWIYASVRMWNEEKNMYDEPKVYAIR